MSVLERHPRGWLAGATAGVLALLCCVGPTVAALLGFTSAAVAADLATDLYSDWGWAFKAVGIAFAAGALWLARRRARVCSAELKPNLKRFAVMLAVSGLATYSALYVLTTWLGALASTEPLRVRGDTLQQRVAYSVSELRERYPHVLVEVAGISPSQIMFRVGWRVPHRTTDGYVDEIAERVQDQREATVLLLKSVVEDQPSIRLAGAFETDCTCPCGRAASCSRPVTPPDTAISTPTPLFSTPLRSNSVTPGSECSSTGAILEKPDSSPSVTESARPQEVEAYDWTSRRHGPRSSDNHPLTSSPGAGPPTSRPCPFTLLTQAPRRVLNGR